MKYTYRKRRRLLSLAGLMTALLIAWLQLQQPAGPSGYGTVTPSVAASPAPTGVVAAATDAVLEAQPGLAKVVRAVDGDTLDVELGGQNETVRLIGIDTPETHDPRKPVQCFGEAAAAHARELMEGRNVRLEADPTNSNRDKYNRLLRYVYLPDGQLVNAQLISDGYAFAYVVFPYTRLNEFRALEAQAQQANRGLWAGCNVDQSQTIKQTTSSK